jgi:hypothetical protein
MSVPKHHSEEAIESLGAAESNQAEDWFDELQSAPPFLALEGKSGRPLFLRRCDVAAVYFDGDGDLCVSTEQGQTYALSERCGNRLLAWASRRAEVLERTEEGS